MDDSTKIPYGYCHCGCGQKTSLHTSNQATKGYVRGEPRRYILGHSLVRPRPPSTVGPLIESGDVVVPLSAGYYAVIDAVDARSVLAHTWSAAVRDNTVYAIHPRTGEYLHRFILRAPSGIEVDHEDRDGLNCRRRNIRMATRLQNLGNQKIRSDNTSGYRGVSRVCCSGGFRWRAAIGSQHIGYFDTAEDAARAYDFAARARYGEFASLNLPDGGP